MWLPRWFVVMVAILAILSAITRYPEFKEGVSLIAQDIGRAVQH